MFSSRSPASDVDRLIARRKYGKAIPLLRAEVARDPRSVRLRQQLATVLELAGEKREAIALLGDLVRELAAAGFESKAIALLKRMQRLEPGHDETEELLARQIGDRHRATDEPPARPAEPSSAEPSSAEPPSGPARDAAAAAAAPPGPESATPPVDPAPPSPPLFAGLSSDELLALIRGLELETYEPGELITTEGEEDEALFVLVSGRVRVYVKGPSGRSRQVRELAAGSFFGEISLIESRPRSATISCATPCELLKLDRPALGRIAAVHPGVPELLRRAARERKHSAEEIAARGEIEIPL